MYLSSDTCCGVHKCQWLLTESHRVKRSRGETREKPANNSSESEVSQVTSADLTRKQVYIPRSLICVDIVTLFTRKGTRDVCQLERISILLRSHCLEFSETLFHTPK